MTMRAAAAAIAPSSHLLLHLITQARLITSFSIIPITNICRQSGNYRNFQVRNNAFSMTNSAVPRTSTTLASIGGGGDYAGLSSTFSSKTGELIPVPEHLVPESMIEWGEIPNYLEVLVSEDVSPEKNGKMERTTITVLPEVGCGIDNLETTKKVEVCSESRYVVFNGEKGRDVFVLDRQVGPTTSPDQLLHVETIFQVSPETVSDDDTNASKDDTEPKEQTFPRRIRVSFTVDPTSKKIIKDTITINIERLYSTTSTKGTRWSGPEHNAGGLDARSVMNTIGRDIVYGDVFGVKRVKSGEDVWTLEMDDEMETSLLKRKDADDYIQLPQNLLIHFHKKQTTQSWDIELSHFDMVDSKLYRRSILRSFDGSDGGFGSVQYQGE